MDFNDLKANTPAKAGTNICVGSCKIERFIKLE